MSTEKGVIMMELKELFVKLDRINDPRQSWKVKHKMADIVAIVLLSADQRSRALSFNLGKTSRSDRTTGILPDGRYSMV